MNDNTTRVDLYELAACIRKVREGCPFRVTGGQRAALAAYSMLAPPHREDCRRDVAALGLVVEQDEWAELHASWDLGPLV